MTDEYGWAAGRPPAVRTAEESCSWTGCSRPIHAIGLCGLHYPRDAARVSEAVSFWNKVRKGSGNDCWEWLAAVNESGYGVFRRNRPTHRMAYELTVGPIPAGMTIDHLCGNKHCVRASHMEVVPLAENSRRANAHLRQYTRGELCKRGLHRMAGDNLYVDPKRGDWCCRACKAWRARAARAAAARVRGAA